MIRIRVKKPKRSIIAMKRRSQPESQERYIMMKEVVGEVKAGKETSIDKSNAVRYICLYRKMGNEGGFWEKVPYDHNNPEHVKLGEMPFDPEFGGFVTVKVPTEEEIRERELKKCEEYWKELGVEFE